MSTTDMIEEANMLPVEDRLRLVDSLLRSLNTPVPEIDAQWIAVSRQRLEEVRSRAVEPIPGDEVFAELRARFPRR
jgi:putative addiction module component (TIGR02574 family)